MTSLTWPIKRRICLMIGLLLFYMTSALKLSPDHWLNRPFPLHSIRPLPLPTETQISSPSLDIPSSSQIVRTLLIDNYDSYTYNLWQLLAKINGIEPHVVYNNAYDSNWQKLMEDLDGSFDNIVLSPGPGIPTNPQDFGLCADALTFGRDTIPILGVCLGHQGMAASYGGEVVRAPLPMHGRLSPITHNDDELFRDVPNGLLVVRYHSLIASSPLPNPLQTIAWTPDGTIMALRHRTKPHYGVQFHPESIETSIGQRLLENFKDITMKFYHKRQHIKSSQSIRSISSRKNKEVIRKEIDVRKSSNKLFSKTILVETIKCQQESIIDIFNIFEAVFGNSSTAFLLDSSCSPAVTDSSTCVSYLGTVDSEASEIIDYVGDDHLIIHKWDGGSIENYNISFFSLLRDLLERNRQTETQIIVNNVTVNSQEEGSRNFFPFDLDESLFGYMSYELGLEVEHVLHGQTSHSGRFAVNEGKSFVLLNPQEKPSANETVPRALFLRPSVYVAFDHNTKEFHVIANIDPHRLDSKNEKKQQQQIQSLRQTQQDIVNRIKHTLKDTIIPPHSSTHTIVNQSSSPSSLWASKTREEYQQAIQNCLNEISAGESYEVCLTTQFSGPLRHDLNNVNSIYRILRKHNPAPYAGFLKFNYTMNDSNRGFAICCSSPERFLKMNSTGWISSKPIKGTARRNLDDIIIDQQIIQSLQNDEKTHAENLMITDLVRNDLGRVCDTGSVIVSKLMNIESFATIHQMVTTIEGQLRSSSDMVDALISTFPGGSMTGAPKLRTMEIIRRLENSPRGIYSGAMGRINLRGSCDLNIIIRTAVIQNGNLTIGTGGAIVALSDVNEEVEEVILKAQAVSLPLGYRVSFKEK